MIFELFPLICLNSCISRNTIYMDFQVYVPKIMYDNIYYPFNVCRLIAMSSFIPNIGYSYFLFSPITLRLYLSSNYPAFYFIDFLCCFSVSYFTDLCFYFFLSYFVYFGLNLLFSKVS